MADLNHSFDHFAFTSEEKEQLTDRLRQAAEQEERMKEPTKRIIRHTGHRLLIGAGAADHGGPGGHSGGRPARLF